MSAAPRPMPISLGGQPLTVSQRLLLAVLFETDGAASHAHLSQAIGHSPNPIGSDISLVRVHISHLRARLHPLRIVIQNDHGRGYALAAHCRPRLRALFDRETRHRNGVQP
ncbi:MAG: helix-turn-helix domain-containing protein [Proteobacteria bacterium]|nr:helix-turn-helix domain-containing protein [Pseudomonadota bacterium]